ncbi:hypothetical protein SAMN05216428_102210 [Nitrosospira sp. Nsp11]|nr:hypothetical protein SAMN05216428_102210 [Nitrosospira sp. Nsp11]
MYGMFKWGAEESDILLFFLYLSFLLFFSLSQPKRSRQSAQTGYRSAFINEYAFPDSIMEQVRNHYPHLSDEHLRLVMQGLSQYFQFCYMSGKEEISMPSRVVDRAWHEFILITRSYERFCWSTMGRFLHHIPASEASSSVSFAEGISRAWRLACDWEGINRYSPERLPSLFAIDNALKIPDGFNHVLNNNYAISGGPHDNASEGGCGGDGGSCSGDGGCGGGCGGGG